MLRRLLAVLLTRAGTQISADAIIDALWNGQPPQTARRTLSAYVSRLRQVLGDDDRVEASAGGYAIHPEPDELDSTRFDRLAAAAARESGARADALIREALGLWRGPAYDGLRDVAVIAATADLLDQARLNLFEESVDLDLASGRHADVLGPLSKLIVEHPYRERLRGQYMLALHHGGRRAEALETYRETYALLTDDLGVEPGTALQDLHQRMLAGDPRLDTARPTMVRPNLLPRAAAHFTGRHDQLAGLDKLATRWDEDGTSPVAILSTITGAAGVGKTALAVHWARGAHARFPDGQLYIDLRGYGGGDPLDPYTALSHLLREMGVTADDMPDDEQAAVARYRSILADAATLVVLDNAASVTQVRPLLPAGSRCMAVVTSRDRLTGLIARDGARRILVDLLTVDESLTLLASIVGVARIDAEPQASAALVAICGQLPLALRIAGAALTDEPGPVAAYVQRLTGTNRLSALSIDGDPESSVRTAFSHSYLRLAPDAAQMFRLLGLIAGTDIGVPAAAALADCSDDDALRLLDRLTAAHLMNEPAPGRYAFHDLIRDYAREIAATEEASHSAQQAVDRIVTWYVTQTDNADRTLRPAVVITRQWVDPQISVPTFERAADAFTWFDVEGDNVLRTVRSLETTRPAACCALVSAAFGWLDGHRRMRDWIEIQTVGVRAATLSGDLNDEAQMRSGLGNALVRAGRHAEALPHFERCLQIRRESGAPLRQVATAMMNVAGLLSDLTRYAEAIDYNDQVLSIVEEATPDLDFILPPLLANTGATHYLAGNVQKAIDYDKRALILADLSGDDADIANVCHNLGEALMEHGDDAEAAELFERSMAHAVRIGSRLYQARSAAALGRMAVRRGRVQEARACLTDAVNIFGEHAEPVIDVLRAEIDALATGQTAPPPGGDLQ